MSLSVLELEKVVYTDEQLDNQLPPNLFCLEMGIDQGGKKKHFQGFCFKILP